MKFIELTAEQFIKEQDNYPLSTFYQTTSWAHIKNTTNWENYYVGIEQEGKIVAICLLLAKKTFLNKKLFYAPRGPLLDYTDCNLLSFFTENVTKFIKSKNGYMLKIDPMITYNTYIDEDKKEEDKQGHIAYQNIIDNNYRHLGFTKGYGTETQFRWSYCLNIENKTIDDIIKNLKTSARGWIRRSQKYPLITKEVKEENLDDFKMVMEHTAERQNHFDRSRNYYQMLQKEFANRCKMLIVYLDVEKYLKENKDDKLYEEIKKEKVKLLPLAASVFILDKERVNYVYGGAIRKYMLLAGQYKYQYDMLKYSTENNYKIYDFGGISGNFDKNDPHYGIYGFKKAFKGYIVEYVGEFDLVINKFYYNAYKIAYKCYKNLRHIIGKLKKW